MRMLITGGTGFVGTNCVDFMLRKYKDLTITVVDNGDASTNRHNKDYLLATYPDRCIVYHVDVRDRQALEEVFRDQKRFDTVIHLAAVGSNWHALDNPKFAFETNIQGTINVFDLAQQYGVDKFCNNSTTETYGPRHPSSTFFTEESPLQPRTPYNISKAEADKYILEHMNDTMRTFITRSSNIYGERQHPHAVIASMIRSCLLGKPIKITGDGNQSREFTHVMDVCSAFDTILHKGQPGIYNIGSGENVSINRLAEIIQGHFDREEDLRIYGNQRPYDDRQYGLNHTKLGGLGWKPTVELEGGLRRTVEWYKSIRGELDFEIIESSFGEVQQRVLMKQNLFNTDSVHPSLSRA